MDSLVHGLALGDRVRVVAAISTETVRTAIATHDAGPMAASALGRLITATALMGSTNKGNEQLTVQLQGKGSAGRILARAFSEGRVFGTVQHPLAETEYDEQGVLLTARAVGTQGLVVVTRDLGYGEPYVGVTMLSTGEVADELVSYFDQSEQIHTALGISVQLSASDRCSFAGGFFVQILGGVSEQEIEELEASVSAMRSLGAELRAGMSALELAAKIGGPDFRVLAESELRYECPYDRNWYLSRLQTLDVATLESAFGSDDTIAVECEYSRRVFTFSRRETFDRPLPN